MGKIERSGGRSAKHSVIFRKASLWACRSAGRTPDVASGAHELRATGKTSAVRVFYFVKLADAILGVSRVPEEDAKDPKREMALGQQRLKEVLHGNV